MLMDLLNIEKENLLTEVSRFKEGGYRLAAVTCQKEGENYEVTYHFDLEYNLKNLRIVLKQKDFVKSISNIYPPAFLIENEFQDLYGFVFEGLTIDYKGNLYLAPDAPKTPMA